MKFAAKKSKCLKMALFVPKDLCESSNLNGMNLGPVESDGTDISWNNFGYNKAFDYYQSLKSVKMAIRPQ